MLSFKPRGESQVAIWILLILPVLMQLPALLGYWNPDPSVFVGNLGDHFTMKGGYPWIDPNVGFQAQALGKLSAEQWLSGQIPWWNSFNGVGLPLAAEAQPGSFFLPFVLLYHFRAGGLWVEVILQIIAGLFSYALIRKLKLTQLAAFIAAVVFEFNGTFSWHGAPIISPIAFLPMLLLGVEQLRARVVERRAGGWFLVPLALAWSIYAGFPETAYIDGLFAGLWVVTRLAGLDRHEQLRFVAKLSLAVAVGLCLSVPLLLPFAEYLSLAYVGGHDGAFAHAALPAASSLVSLMPWLFGSIDQFNGQLRILVSVWSNVGGYFTALQVTVAILGVLLVPRRLTVALLVWMLLCLSKTYDWRPISDLMNMLPMIKSAAFFRYSPPSWEFAGAVLIAFAIDGLQKDTRLSPRLQSSVFALFLVIVCAGLRSMKHLFRILLTHAEYPPFFYGAIGWLVFSIVTATVFFLVQKHWNKSVWALALLLVVDACAAFALPICSGAQQVKHDGFGVAFLRVHAGLQRIYSMGPLAPNYGAYFQIAQINHNYLPISRDWVDYIHHHLDPSADAITFIGRTDHVSVEDKVTTRRTAYEELGVKYVLTSNGSDPFSEMLNTDIESAGNQPLELKEGQDVLLDWSVSPITVGKRITEINVQVGNYGNHADGQLVAQVCVEQKTCATGERSLRGSTDNAPLRIVLDQPLSLPTQAQSRLTIKLSYEKSTSSMALWVWPSKGNSPQKILSGGPSGYLPGISLKLDSPGDAEAIQLVYSQPDMSIYELPGAKPYFEVSGGPCLLQSVSRVQADIDCQGPAILLRREAFYPGWQASINGSRVPLTRSSEIFQQVRLIEGKQQVVFSYYPSHLIAIIFGFVLGVAGLLYASWREWSDRKRRWIISEPLYSKT